MLILPWDPASWHRAHDLLAWIRAHNRQVQRSGSGVKLVPVELPKGAFWLNRVDAIIRQTLLQALPEARRFFVSERWGGYAKSSRDVDAVQNPVVMALLMAAWFVAVAMIVLGWWSPWAALVNLALCRYFFIHMRWKGILRGMGAPGFMAYWTGLAVFLLEYASRFAPDLIISWRRPTRYR